MFRCTLVLKFSQKILPTKVSGMSLNYQNLDVFKLLLMLLIQALSALESPVR